MELVTEIYRTELRRSLKEVGLPDLHIHFELHAHFSFFGCESMHVNGLLGRLSSSQPTLTQATVEVQSRPPEQKIPWVAMYIMLRMRDKVA